MPERTPAAADWGQIVVLVGASVAAAFGLAKVPPALPLLRRELGLDALTAGWVISVFGTIGALGGAGFGQLADRLGRRRMVLVGLAVMAAASAAGAFARTPAALLAERTAEGFGFVCLAVAIPPLIVAAAPDPAARRVALGWWSSYVGTGSAIVLLAAPALLARGDWPALWLACSAAAALAALVVALRIPADRGGGPRGDLRADLRGVLGARFPAAAALAFAAYTASYFILFGYLPTILVGLGASVGGASLLTAIVVTANAIGNFAGGAALRRFPRFGLMAFGAAVMGTAGAVVELPWLPLGWRLAAASLAMFCGALIPGAVSASLPVLAPRPELISTTQGLVNQGSNVGQLVGPVLVAAVGGTAGGPAAGLVLLALAVTGIGLAAALSRAPRA